MIYLNSPTALDEAFPRVGDGGLFSTFLDLLPSRIRLHLVGTSSFQIVCDERVETPPAVGVTTPPLLYAPYLSVRLLVIFTKLGTRKGFLSRTLLFFGVRSAIPIFRCLRGRERRSRLTFILQIESNLPIVLIWDPG